MKQENFPKYNTLTFKSTRGLIARTHFNFLKSLRNKPELIYNVLSIDINEINKENNKKRRKENKIEYLKKDAEYRIKNLEKEYEKKKNEIENSEEKKKAKKDLEKSKKNIEDKLEKEIKKVIEEEIKIEIKEKDIPLLFDYIFNLFYGGSMSNKKIEEYVLALIWSFLQDALNEINDERDIMEIFNKRVGYIFKYLYKQKEIKEYFNKILSFEFKTIEFNNNGNWLFEEMKDINESTSETIKEEMDKFKNTMNESEKYIYNKRFNVNKAIYIEKLKEFENEK